MYIYIYIRTYTYIYTHMYIYICKYIHIYMNLETIPTSRDPARNSPLPTSSCLQIFCQWCLCAVGCLQIQLYTKAYASFFICEVYGLGFRVLFVVFRIYIFAAVRDLTIWVTWPCVFPSAAELDFYCTHLPKRTQIFGTFTQTRAQPHIHTGTLTHTHTHGHTHTRTRTRTRTRTHKHTHAHIHTHTHTHIHICICISHKFRRLMSHIWMSHITRMNESCHSYESVTSRKCTSHVTDMNESCHTYAWVMSHICMSHVTHI